ncbi:hypothetical protein Anapl_11690, partial [Anas platyrhynchos]
TKNHMRKDGFTCFVYVQRSKLINKPLQWAPVLCKAGL